MMHQCPDHIMLCSMQPSKISDFRACEKFHFSRLQNGVLQTSKSLILIAEAVLLTKNLKFFSHKGVISLFGQYVKTSIFPRELSRDLAKAHDERLAGD